MDEDGFAGDFFGRQRVAIWGLGLMGGSLALALRESDSRVQITGIDPDEGTRTLALERGIVDAAFSPDALASGVERLGVVDLIVLAAPVRAILQTLADLPMLVDGQPVVLDLGSTKAEIVDAMNRLPDRFDPVGGHPMCGKEQSSLRHADADLYRDAPFALVAARRTSNRGKLLAESLARAIDACPLWIESDTHDRWVAATSHVPFLLSGAMVRATPPEAAPLVGPGFRGMARLSGGSTRMMMDILQTNRANVRAALDRIRKALDEWDALLEHGDDAAIAALLDETSQRYSTLKGDR